MGKKRGHSMFKSMKNMVYDLWFTIEFVNLKLFSFFFIFKDNKNNNNNNKNNNKTTDDQEDQEDQVRIRFNYIIFQQCKYTNVSLFFQFSAITVWEWATSRPVAPPKSCRGRQ